MRRLKPVNSFVGQVASAWRPSPCAATASVEPAAFEPPGGTIMPADRPQAIVALMFCDRK
jgi:hypothetical protein